MKIYQAIAKKNECYILGLERNKENPVGIVVHSTGANNPMLKRYVDLPGIVGVNPNRNTWNTFNPEGRQVCAHAFIGKLEDGTVSVVETLPHWMECWLVGSYNPTKEEAANGMRQQSFNFYPKYHQFEICEDGLEDEEYFNTAMNTAIEYCAYICTLYNIPTKNIVSHKEAHAMKFGCNHGDPENWMDIFHMTMDDFRQRVDEFIANQDKQESYPIKPEDPVTQKLYRIQVGAFASLPNAQKELKRIKEIGSKNNFQAFISYL